jgi:membrane associated rhomboid family serine protease
MVINDDLLLRVLQACADAAPAPLFPADGAGLDRATLDAALDRLRLNGLVEIADWVQGKGQGYRATAAGAEALHRQRIAPAPPPAEDVPDAADTAWQRGEEARAALLKPAPPIVTRILVFANLAVFAWGMWLARQSGLEISDYPMRGHNPVLFSLTWIHATYLVHLHQFWRLLSHQFVHGNLLHLALNMYALFSLGQVLEALWGWKRFLPLYLIAGWVGGCAVLLTNRFAVGASGAICGLLTSMAVWLWLNREHLPDELRAAWWRNIIVNLVLMVWISVGISNVSWEGHLGGAIGGAMVSFPLHYLHARGWWRRAAALLGVAAVPALALAVGLAPHWRTMWAHWHFGHRLLVLEHAVLEQHNRFAIPLLNRGAAAWVEDEAFLPAGREACADLIGRLQPVIDELEARMPEEDTQLGREMRQTRVYLVAWSEFFEALKRALDRPQQWPIGRRELLSRRDALLEHSRPLRNHEIMPPLDPLEVEKKERPADAAPPNVA